MIDALITGALALTWGIVLILIIIAALLAMAEEWKAAGITIIAALPVTAVGALLERLS